MSIEDNKTLPCTSDLYCIMPPICTVARVPFVPAMLLRKYQGLGFRKAILSRGPVRLGNLGVYSNEDKILTTTEADNPAKIKLNRQLEE